MNTLPDWIALWRELSEIQNRRRQLEHGDLSDPWVSFAWRFRYRVHQRWSRPDSSRELIAEHLRGCPGCTLLDIGAGTGAWEGHLAQYVDRITAVEPSPSMIEVMREHMDSCDVTNVEIVRGFWPDVDVPVHDFSLCSHAMYGMINFETFIRSMEAKTRHTCFLLLRAPESTGVLAQAAQHVWGHPYDSPNFQVAYNALLQMGIFASVRFEEPGRWKPRTSASIEEALQSVKRHIALEDEAHDGFLREMLRAELVLRDGQYVWPADVRSALVYWRPGQRAGVAPS